MESATEKQIKTIESLSKQLKMELKPGFQTITKREAGNLIEYLFGLVNKEKKGGLDFARFGLCFKLVYQKYTNCDKDVSIDSVEFKNEVKRVYALMEELGDAIGRPDNFKFEDYIGGGNHG